jgi:Uma2 family endonuclease
MGMHAAITDSMTIDEFYAFTDASPEKGKWELIRGEPILNASPSPLHQRIVMNVSGLLWTRQRETKASWEVLPGLGVKVSEEDRPEPDVVVVPRTPLLAHGGDRHTADPIVAVEVLSPSTRKRDRGWKRDAYTGLASLTHYVVITQDMIEVTVFAREDGFEKRVLTSIADVLHLRSLDAVLPLTEIYRDTGL